MKKEKSFICKGCKKFLAETHYDIGKNGKRNRKCKICKEEIRLNMERERKKKKNSKKLNNIKITHPHLVEEWDFELNTVDIETLSYGSGQIVHWKCKNGHRWTTKLCTRTTTKPNNCGQCSNKIVCKDNCLAITHPHLLEEWDYDKNKIKPTEITAGSDKEIYWICKKGHTWSTCCWQRTGKRATNCGKCSNKIVCEDNCLSSTHPHLLKEWDYEKNDILNIKPFDVMAGTDKKVYWICLQNSEHKWMTTICSRAVRNYGCPYCVNKIVCKDNCLATTHPHLLKEWDYEKNEITPEEITYGSGKVIHWKCEKGHIWSTPVKNRTEENPTACPQCYEGKHHSKISIIWLTALSKMYDIYIQHAENGGEIKIKSSYQGGFYSFDGYCKETNTVYEFYGCDVHGCPDCTDHDKFSTLTKRNYFESFAKTLEREDYIKSKGYNLVCIWEHEFKEIYKIFYLNNLTDDERYITVFPRDMNKRKDKRYINVWWKIR